MIARSILLVLFAAVPCAPGMPLESQTGQQQRELASQDAQVENGQSAIAPTKSSPAPGAPGAAPAVDQVAQQATMQREMVELTRSLAEYTNDLAKYTLALVIVGIVIGALQVALLYFQGQYTGKAATSAKTSANAVMLAERAYVTISHQPPGIETSDRAITQAGQEQFGGWHDATVRFEIKNYGNTPARITDIALGTLLASSYRSHRLGQGQDSGSSWSKEKAHSSVESSS